MIEFIGRILRRIFRGASDLEKLEQLKQYGLVVGNNLALQPGVIIDQHHCWHIRIGDDVGIASGVIILSHDASMKKYLGYTRVGKIDIGDKVVVGAGSVILPGVTIGDNSIIGAGSVVAKDIPPDVVAAGNPAKVICSLDEYIERHKKELEASPKFGKEYTTKRNVTAKMRDEMNRKMVNRIGYIE